MQCFLVGYRGIRHLSLVFSSYTHEPKGSCVYGNTSDARHIPRNPTRKHCITSIYYTILYYTILCYIILCYVMLCCVVLWCVMLYYIILYYSIE